MPASSPILTNDPDMLARSSAGTHDLRLVAEIIPVDSTTDFARLTAGLTHTPFQSPFWLTAWFATIGTARNIEGFWLTLRAGTCVILAMPLIRRREAHLVVLEMPDCGVTDYAAPLLGDPHRLERYTPEEIWSQLLATLPDADLLRLERSPMTIRGRENPLVAHPAALTARISGWYRSLPDSGADLHAALSSTMRERLGKSGRRFARVDHSRIAPITETAEAIAALDQLSAWQAERMDQKGCAYELDQPDIALFYQCLVTNGMHSGQVLMMALSVEQASLALNFGVRAGDCLTYLRVGNTFGKWAPFALGILATDAIIREAHARGARQFDFGAGDYEYKARFGAKRMPLFDIVLPLSLRAMPHVLALQARRRLSRITWLKHITSRLRSLIAKNRLP